MNRSKILFSVALAAVALVAVPARAATASATLAVTASVAKVCQVSVTTNLDFGAFDPIAATAQNDVAPAALSVACTKNTTFTVDLGAGRTVANGADTIPFALYSDSGRTTVWAAQPGTGKQVVSVWGKLNPASTPLDVNTGNYSTNLTVTVTY